MGDKCTFGTRMPIDIHMLNEIIYREVKHFRNYNHYRPTFGSVPVTGKFYAAHDMFDESKQSEEEAVKVKHYHKKVSEARVEGPHSKYPMAATENQVYGWYYRPVYPINRSDRRFNFPKRESEHTKIEVIIEMQNPKKKNKEAR